MPLASPNSLNLAVTTTADNSGLDSAKAATTGYVSQVEIATQKVQEFAAAQGMEGSATLSASDEVVRASSAVESYATKLDTASQKSLEVAKSQGTSSAAFNQSLAVVDNLGQKYDQAIQTQDKVIEEHVKNTQATEEEDTGTKNLTGSIVGAQIVYQALITVLQRVQQVLSSSVTAANQYEMALASVNSTARGMGDNSEQATQAAQKLSSSGLIPLTQSFTAYRNLLQSGFSVPQATQLLGALTDKAVLNRSATLSLGDAVVSASKGIELGNSKSAEAAGNNEKMTDMLKQAGVATTNLGNLQGSAAARQAILNGFIQNSADSLGNANRASDMFSAKQQQAATAVQNLQIQLGGIEQLIGGPLLQAFGNFIQTHQKLIIDFGISAVAAVAVTAAIIGLGVAITSIVGFLAAADPAMIVFAVLATAIGVALGGVVFKAVDSLQSKFKDYLKTLGDGSNATSALTDQTGQLTKAQQDLQNKLAEIDEQIAKNERDYMQSLATTIQGIQTKISDLNSQISTENDSFADSQTKNLDSYNKTMDSMTTAHQKRVDTIQKQLDQETALGKWADKAKLDDLEQQLSDENSQYNQSVADQKTTYDQSVQDAKDAHDKKISDLQTQLNQEQDLIQKHAADVAAVQNTTLLDEIDKIKQSHDNQVASFADQKTQAINSAAQTSQGIVQSFNDQSSNMNTSGSNLATSFINGLNGNNTGMTSAGSMLADAFSGGFNNEAKTKFTQFSVGFVNFFENIPSFLGKSVSNGFNAMDTGKNSQTLGQIWDNTMKQTSGRATGGPVSAGQPYLVGDNPDGSLNNTTEMFVPDQPGTILSASQTRSALSSGSGSSSGSSNGGVTIYQTNYNSSQVDMDAANVTLGWRLVNA